MTRGAWLIVNFALLAVVIGAGWFAATAPQLARPAIAPHGDVDLDLETPPTPPNPVVRTAAGAGEAVTRRRFFTTIVPPDPNAPSVVAGIASQPAAAIADGAPAQIDAPRRDIREESPIARSVLDDLPAAPVDAAQTVREANPDPNRVRVTLGPQEPEVEQFFTWRSMSYDAREPAADYSATPPSAAATDPVGGAVNLADAAPAPDTTPDLQTPVAADEQPVASADDASADDDNVAADADAPALQPTADAQDAVAQDATAESVNAEVSQQEAEEVVQPADPATDQVAETEIAAPTPVEPPSEPNATLTPIAPIAPETPTEDAAETAAEANPGPPAETTETEIASAAPVEAPVPQSEPAQRPSEPAAQPTTQPTTTVFSLPESAFEDSGITVSRESFAAPSSSDLQRLREGYASVSAVSVSEQLLPPPPAAAQTETGSADAAPSDDVASLSPPSDSIEARAAALANDALTGARQADAFAQPLEGDSYVRALAPFNVAPPRRAPRVVELSPVEIAPSPVVEPEVAAVVPTAPKPTQKPSITPPTAEELATQRVEAAATTVVEPGQRAEVEEGMILLGVYSSRGRDRALIRTVNGAVRVELGDEIDGWRVVTITDASIQLRRGAQSRQLQLP